MVSVAETSAACGDVQVPGVYTQEYADAALSYPSGSYLDDMAYAAAWMYHSTKVLQNVCMTTHTVWNLRG